MLSAKFFVIVTSYYGCILRFSWGWHYISLKKNAVKVSKTQGFRHHASVVREYLQQNLVLHLLAMNYVRHGAIQGRYLVFFKAHGRVFYHVWHSPLALNVIRKKKFCVLQNKVLSFGPNRTVEVWPNRTFSRSLMYRVNDLSRSHNFVFISSSLTATPSWSNLLRRVILHLLLALGPKSK